MNREEKIAFIDEFLSRCEDWMHGEDGEECTKSRKYLSQLSNTNQAKEEKCILPNFDKSGQCFKCGIYVENHFHPSKD